MEKEKGEKKLCSFGFECLRCRERANENLVRWKLDFFFSFFVFRIEKKMYVFCIFMRFVQDINYFFDKLIHF